METTVFWFKLLVFDTAVTTTVIEQFSVTLRAQSNNSCLQRLGSFYFLVYHLVKVEFPSSQIQEEMQQRYDKERKELETTYQRNLHQKENRIHDLENINKV